jgi:DNA-binding MarR family transcriptional regulator/GNAT superfamily N-acetyltransferase
MTATPQTVAAVRRFNRFYTRAIGVLDRAFLGGPYTLAESRVLHDIGEGEGVTPGEVAQALDLDPGYLSRMVARLQRDGLVARASSPRDRRSIVLSLTEAGRAHLAVLNARQVARIEALTAGLSPADHARLTSALVAVQGLLQGEAPPTPVTLRPHRPGDMGWVVERHATLYGAEYGWSDKIEAVTARIVADFLEHADPARARCWIAERAGERLGSVFLVDDGEGVARLRLLMLDPAARGQGLGRRMVDECIAFARAAGYREVVLWTHAVLTAARRIYADAGFQLEKTWTHEEFGGPEVSETWRLRL